MPAFPASTLVKAGVYNFKPMVFFEEGHEPSGLYVDVLNHIAEKEGWQIIYIPGSWNDCLKRLESGEIDIVVCIGYSEERAKIYDYPKGFLILDWGLIYQSKDIKIDSIFDLKNQTIAVLKSSIYTIGFKSLLDQFSIKAKLIEKSDYKEVFKAIENHEADAGICANIAGMSLEVNYPVERTSIMFSPVRISYAVLKGKNAVLLEALDRHIQEMKVDDHSFLNLKIREWIEGGQSHIPRKVIMGIIVLFGGIIFLFAFVIILRLRVKAKTKALVEQNIELHQSENRFRGIFEQAAVGVAIVGIDGKWLRVNNKLCEIVSYPKEELLNLTFQDITHPEDLDSDLEFYKKALEGIISTYTLEKRYIKKTGGNVWINLTVSLVRDEKKSPIFFIAVIDDISSRKIAENARKESEKQYRGLLMNLQVGIVVHAPDTRILISNAAASQILGLSENQILGKEAIDPEWKFLRDDGSIMPVEEYPVNMVIRTGQPLTRYIVGIRKNQTQQIAWVLVSAYPSFFENNELQQVVVTFIDISELKQAEAALLAEKERLAVTLRSIGDGVITTDTDGRITLMNKVAEELTGWMLKDAVGKPLDEVFRIINKKTRIACENPAHKVITTGNSIELENHTVLVSRYGDERIIADSGAPILDKNSKIIGVVLVFRDMTEKQKIEDALQNALKLESLNILAGGIAHDFNNLLGGIFGFIDMALEYANDGDLENIKTSITDSMTVFERAKDLTQQLLTFAKGGDPVRKIGDIGKLVRDSFQFALTGSNVSISFDIPDCPFICDFDKNQMGQVIDNMAINARQAMPLGGKLEVVLSKVPPHKAPALLPRVNYVRISITDNGPGISRENLQHIFDPFFTTKKQGTGLGLATCYSIIKRHDGIIEVETEESKGTNFHIYLPEASGQAEIAETGTKTAYKGSGRILVMDDQESIIKVTSSMLSRLGYSVVSASNGDEAVELVRQAHNENQSFVAAILDLTIPGGRGGKDSVDEILDIDPSIKLVAASGYSGDSIMSNPSAFGFSACLIKPFRVSELTKVLESLAIGI